MGHSAERAVDLIYRVSGATLSVTKIIHKMIANKRTGGCPALGTAAT